MAFNEKLLIVGSYAAIVLAVSALVWYANFQGIVSYPVFVFPQ